MNRFMIAALFALSLAAPAFAEWPDDRPIRILVGFGAGGGTDIVTRIIAQPLSELLHQTIVVENKPGAGGSLATDVVAKAPHDGYTATMLSTGHTVSAAMMKSLPFDPVKDFTPVAMVASSCLVIVTRKDLPADDVKGLIVLAKAEPGKLNFGTVGLGSTQHMAGELFREMSDIKVKHIPYRGTPLVIQALRNKEIDYAVELLQAVIGQVNAGDLKLLAVAPPKRWPTVPNVPSIGETVPGYSVVGWYGLVFPAGTPQPIVDKMNAALREVLARPAIREQLTKIGAEVQVTSPQEFGKLLNDEVAKWKSVRDKAGLEPQ
jgi:tripartite-type tricarboxylate transporter receptor subunit TctC